MSLLDGITSAKGGAGANYLRKGRHLLRISRMAWREESADLAAQFRLDGMVVATTGDQEMVNNTGTANVNFGKFKTSSLTNVRRICRVVKEVLDGQSVSESDINRDVVENQLCGPKQPAVGAFVVILGIEKTSKDGNQYTTYEAEVPNERDLATLESLGMLAA